MSGIFEQARMVITPNIIETLFPGGKWEGDEYWIQSPLDLYDKNPRNFSISKKDDCLGCYFDFANGDHGDLIDLVSRVSNIKKLEAAKKIIEVSGECPVAKDRITEYIYLNADGTKAFIQKRVDHYKGGKDIYTSHPDGTRGLPPQFKGVGMRPLYNLPSLMANPNTPVLVVEGEKNASETVPGMILTTWSGGSSSVKNTDFTPLYNRSVTLWPDNDATGKTAMLTIAIKLHECGSTVRMIAPPIVKKQGWDISDAIIEGFDSENLIANAVIFRTNDEEQIPARDLIPMGHDLDRIFSYKIELFTLGATFARLNDPDYSLIRNGFITIGAESNAGKSSILSAMALDILQHNQDTALLIYSLDDSTQIAGKRILSQLTETNLFKTSEIPATIIRKHAILDRIFLCDDLKLPAIEADAVRVKEITGCTRIIVGIDYLQIINNPDPKDNQREFFNGVVKELKEIQKRLRCLVILLSQFNRDTASTTYRYRETSEIENQSDVCIDIIGKYKKVKDPDTSKQKIVPDRESPVRYISISKNKLGRKGQQFKTGIDCTFNFSALEPTGDFDMGDPAKQYSDSLHAVCNGLDEKRELFMTDAEVWGGVQ